MKYKAYMRKLEAQQLLTQKEYDQYVNDSIQNLRCHNCSSPVVTRHATYQRHLYKTREDRTIIEVQRMKCCSCFITFVLLPESIIPYKRYSLVSLVSFLTVVLEVNKTRCRKWFDLNNHYIDFLLRQYKQMHEKWVHTIDHLFPPEDALSFGRRYHQQVGKKFMQIIPNPNEPISFI